LLVHCTQSLAFGPVSAHTPDWHAREPSPRLQVPPGIGCPSGVFGVQTPAAPRLSHQFPAPHSTSVKHVVPHAPVATLQNGPAWPAPHWVSTVHTEQTPVPMMQ
jgi:hypothetical protein